MATDTKTSFSEAAPPLSGATYQVWCIVLLEKQNRKGHSLLVPHFASSLPSSRPVQRCSGAATPNCDWLEPLCHSVIGRDWRSEWPSDSNQPLQVRTERPIMHSSPLSGFEHASAVIVPSPQPFQSLLWCLSHSFRCSSLIHTATLLGIHAGARSAETLPPPNTN